MIALSNKKQNRLPKDINWHMVGHLQTNKVKAIAPFINLIHSVDSLKLLQEIDKQAAKNDRIIHCLLQIYIADEETKYGLDFDEAVELLRSDAPGTVTNFLKYINDGTALDNLMQTVDKAWALGDQAALERYLERDRLRSGLGPRRRPARSPLPRARPTPWMFCSMASCHFCVAGPDSAKSRVIASASFPAYPSGQGILTPEDGSVRPSASSDTAAGPPAPRLVA